MSLRLSDSLILPLEVVTMTQAILARKRSGKSYCAQKLAEQMLHAGQQIVAIDPTSAWYGLRSSADGNGPGFPIVVFGGAHADAPLDYRSGASLAGAIVEHGFSAIFDVGEMDVEEQVVFGTDFCKELLKLNRNAMHLFMDEAHNWAPQNPVTKPEKHALSAVKRLVLQGGIRGIGFTMISQRTALLNKDVLSQVDLLTVLRMSHPLDIKAVTDWIASEVSAGFAGEVKSALPGLPIGTAFINSAPLNLGQRIQIAPKETFNSGATPKPGERKVEPNVLAHVDIQKLGTQIAASVEEQEANAPEALKRRIAELERQGLSKEKEQMLVEQIQKMEQDLAEARTRLSGYAEIESEIRSLHGSLAMVVQKAESVVRLFDGKPSPPAEYTNVPNLKPSPTPSVAIKPTGDLTSSHVKILKAMASLSAIGVTNPERVQVAFFAGYSNPKSGGFAQPMADLVSRGYVQAGAGSVSLTPRGHASVGPQRAATTVQLHGMLRDLLGGGEWKMLEVLIHAYPRSVERTKLAETTGYSNAKSGGFAGPLARLISLGLAKVPTPGLVAGTKLLFVEGA